MQERLRALGRWLEHNQEGLIISAAVAIAVAVVLARAFRLLTRAVDRLPSTEPWPRIAAAARSSTRLHPLWVAIASAYAALLVSPVPELVRERLGRVLWTIALLSVAVALLRFTREAIRVLGQQARWPDTAARLAFGAVAAVVGLNIALTLLQLWGVPTAPMLVVSAVVFVLALVALRDVLPTLVAAAQVTLLDRIEPGDYLALEGGEEGTVEAITWRHVVLRSVDGSQLRVPHPKVVRVTVRRHGPPPRKAERPLRFVHRSHLRELTGLRARNLEELADGLRRVPDSAIYYHTHQYLEEHQYLVPCPANAFAEWVERALGLPDVAEELAAIRVLDVAKLATVREAILRVLEPAIARQHEPRHALPGHELYFVQSVTVMSPCPYTASDLNELAGVIRRLSLSSLFYHMFEARLLGGDDAERDIPTWLRRQLGENELAAQIGRLSPWDYTFEGLRAAVLQRIEARR